MIILIFQIIVFFDQNISLIFFCKRWIPCQASTSVLCIHYRPEDPVTVHCSTKDAYTSKITFLAYFSFEGTVNVILSDVFNYPKKLVRLSLNEIFIVLILKDDYCCESGTLLLKSRWSLWLKYEIKMLLLLKHNKIFGSINNLIIIGQCIKHCFLGIKY